VNLHELLEDAVADVEPADRLSELRARTASPARAAARPWWWAAGATVAATAAAVAVVAVVADDGTDPGHHHHDMATEPPTMTELVPAYFVGPSPGRDRLYREFDEVPAGDPIQGALDRIQQAPGDPDYRTTWAPGSFDSAELLDGTIQVEVGTAGLPAPGGIAAQQLVYTLQGAAGARLPVQLLDGGKPIGDPYQAAPADAVLNRISISDPAEGNSYEDSFVARGRADVRERHVNWDLSDLSGAVVARGVAIVGEQEGFEPWEATVDLDDLQPGTYVFTATTDDEAFAAPSTDTRSIVVR
jgi:hypothetical protein